MHRIGHTYRLVLSAVLLLVSVCVGAQPRSEAEALTVARSFLGQQAGARKAPRLVVVREQTVDGMVRRRAGSQAGSVQQEEKRFYVFNDEANDRYVIVSGDERQEAVLGYADEGLFDPEDIPCGLRTFLDQYAREYELLQQKAVVQGPMGGDDKAEPAETAVPRRAEAISPLLKTKWGQSPYYNNDCPMEPKTNKRCITGCVATAMAQIMKYHNYPSVGQGSTSYKSSKNAISQNMNFASVTFEWSKMLNSYDDNSTGAQVNAVAKLMHACGVSLHMDYGSDASGSTIKNIPYALITYFKYPANARYYDRKYHTGDEWEKLILDELKAGRPIAYRGVSDPDSDGNTGGHAFVLDGSDSDGRYHFNFGWRGSSNGYYYLSSIRPSPLGYTNYQAMVCNIDPSLTGNKAEQWYADKFEFNPNTLKFTLTNVWCYSSDASTYYGGFSGFWGWRLEDVETQKSVRRATNDLNNIKMGSGYTQLYQTIDSKDLEEGKSYYLYPIVMNKAKTTSTRIRTEGGKTDYYLLQMKNGKVTATVKGTPTANATPEVRVIGASSDNSDLTKLTKKDVLVVHGTYRNTGATGSVNTRLRIWDADMNAVAASKAVAKSLPGDAETQVDIEYSLEGLQPGNYIVAPQFQATWSDNLWYYNKNQVINITVIAEPEPTAPKIQFVSVTSDNQNLDNLTHNDKLVFRATFKNTGKTYNVKTRLRIWNEEMDPVTVSDSKTTQFKQDGQTTVTFEYSLKDIVEGSYVATIQYLNSWDDNKWYYNKNMLTTFLVKEATNPEIHFVSVDCDNQNLESLTSSDKLKFHATFMNKGKTGNIRTLVMVWNDNTNKKYVSEKVTKSFTKDVETKVDLEYSLAGVEPGTYTAAVLYERYWEEGPNNWWYNTGLAKEITVKEPTEPDVSFVSVTCGNKNPLQLTQDDVLKLTGVFQNNGKTADIQTRVRFFAPDMYNGYTASTRTTTFPQGKQTTENYEVSLKNVEPGTYYVTAQYLSHWTNNKWQYRDNWLIEIHIKASTPVEGILAEEEKEEPIYDLRGQRLTKPRKGINVIGGKKVIVK